MLYNFSDLKLLEYIETGENLGLCAMNKDAD